MDIPSVSVVMPVYNCEDYLESSIDSILNQTFRDFEFLIFNDGSTDRSESVIGEYADKDERIKVFNSGQNRGLVFQLNEGLRLAKGDYIVRMDADDISMPGRLEEQVSFMENNPDFGVCGAWMRLFPAADGAVWVQPTQHEDIFAGMVFRTRIWHPTVIMRRDAIANLDEFYDAEFAHVEDYEYWVRLGLRGVKFANIGKILYAYRRHGESVCNIHEQIQIINSDRIREMILNELGITPASEELALHNLMAAGGSAGGSDLEKSALWLEKIRKANDEKAVFPAEALNEELAGAWMNLLYNSCSNYSALFQLFLKYQPPGAIRITFMQKLVFCMKCLVKRFSGCRLILNLINRYYILRENRLS